jgi:hypothetical protein
MYRWLFGNKIPYLPSWKILRALYKQKHLNIPPYRIFMISHALDNQVADLDGTLKKIVPDLKELVKLGLIISKHSGGNYLFLS